MPLNIHNYIRTSYYLLLTPFHISVTIFIFRMIITGNKKSMYKSSFFTLYLMVSIMDILSLITNCYFQIEEIEFFRSWVTQNLWQLQLSWYFSNYSVCQQSFIHMSIAINRAWVAFFDLKPPPRWTQIGKRAIWILPFVPLPLFPQTFGAHYVYDYLDDGDIFSYFVEPWAQPWLNILSPSVMFATSCITFIFAVITIRRYRNLMKKTSIISISIKQDIRLFTHALVLLMFQLAFVAYYILYRITEYDPEFVYFTDALFYCISDSYCFCNPIALLIVSKKVREDYLDFIGIKKLKVSSIPMFLVK